LPTIEIYSLLNDEQLCPYFSRYSHYRKSGRGAGLKKLQWAVLGTGVSSPFTRFSALPLDSAAAPLPLRSDSHWITTYFAASSMAVATSAIGWH
jgi:hypothetical protein